MNSFLSSFAYFQGNNAFVLKKKKKVKIYLNCLRIWIYWGFLISLLLDISDWMELERSLWRLKLFHYTRMFALRCPEGGGGVAGVLRHLALPLAVVFNSCHSPSPGPAPAGVVFNTHLCSVSTSSPLTSGFQLTQPLAICCGLQPILCLLYVLLIIFTSLI